MAKYNVGDKINFLDWEYILTESQVSNKYYWKNQLNRNDIIFKMLNINSKKFSIQVLNYDISEGFPEMKTLADVAKLTDALLLECAKFRYPVGTKYKSALDGQDGGEVTNILIDKKSNVYSKNKYNMVKFIYHKENNKWAEVITEKEEIEKWSVGSYVVTKEDTRFGTERNIGTICKKGEVNGIQFNYFSDSNIVGLYKYNYVILKSYLEWFPTLQEAEAYSKKLLSKRETFDNCKIWIGDNPELSKKVQEKLFELGYSWESGKDIKRLKANYISIWYNKQIGYSTGSREHFDKHFNREIFPSDLGITVEEEFKIGDILYFLNDKKEFSAPTGSIARCVAPFDGKYIKVKWINDGGVGQSDGEYLPNSFRKATQEEINSVASPKKKNRVVNGVEMIKGEYYYCESNHNPSSYFVFIYDRHGTGKDNDSEINYICTSQQVSTLYSKFVSRGINDAHHANMRLATVIEREWLDACIKAGKYLEPNAFKIEWEVPYIVKFEKLWRETGILPISTLTLTPLTLKDCVKNPLDDTYQELEIKYNKPKQIKLCKI